MKVQEVWSPKKMSASGTVVPRGGSLAGVFCTTAGTVEISDGVDAGGTNVVASFTAVAATWYPLPFKFDRGAYATLGGGFVGTFGAET